MTTRETNRTPAADETRRNDPKGLPTTERDDTGLEFQITVRKLELPVRPRGVLAE